MRKEEEFKEVHKLLGNNTEEISFLKKIYTGFAIVMIASLIGLYLLFAATLLRDDYTPFISLKAASILTVGIWAISLVCIIYMKNRYHFSLEGIATKVFRLRHQGLISYHNNDFLEICEAIRDMK
jgi:hypothetical protein